MNQSLEYLASLHQSGGYPIGKVVIIKSFTVVPLVCAFIRDMENDVFKVEFRCETEILISDTKGGPPVFSVDVLEEISKLSMDSQSAWSALEEYYSKEKDGWFGYDRLVSIPQDYTEAKHLLELIIGKKSLNRGVLGEATYPR